MKSRRVRCFRIMQIVPDVTYAELVVLNSWLLQCNSALFPTSYFTSFSFIEQIQYRRQLHAQPMLTSMLCSFAQLQFNDRGLLHFAGQLMKCIQPKVLSHKKGCGIIVPCEEVFDVHRESVARVLSEGRKIVHAPNRLMSVAVLIDSLRQYPYRTRMTIKALALFEHLFSFYMAELDADVRSSPCTVSVVLDGVHVHKTGSPIVYSLYLKESTL